MVTLVFNDVSVPLMFGFKTRENHILLIISFLVPTKVYFKVCRLLAALKVRLASRLIFVLLYYSPLLTLT